MLFRSGYGKGMLLAAAVLVGAELSVHLFFGDKISGLSTFGYDTESGFVEPGDGTVQLKRTWGRRFHEQSMAVVPEEGVWRVFVVGDSVPRGKGPERAYSGALERALEREGIETECLNMAIPGYGARRLRLVVESALPYKPDLVILHLNDSNEYEDEREYRRYVDLRSWHPRNWMNRPFIFQKQQQQRLKLNWRYLPEEVRAASAQDDAVAEQAASKSEENVRAWRERVAEETEKTVKTIRASGARVLLLTQCRYEEGRLLRNDYLESLAASLSGEGVGHVSMYEVMANRDAAEHFADSSHLFPSGHEILGEALLPTVGALLAR